MIASSSRPRNGQSEAPANSHPPTTLRLAYSSPAVFGVGELAIGDTQARPVCSLERLVELPSPAIDDLLLPGQPALVCWTDTTREVLHLLFPICQTKRCPLFVVGNDLSRDDTIAALSLGADDVLETPLHPLLLQAKITAFLRRHPVTETDPHRLASREARVPADEAGGLLRAGPLLLYRMRRLATVHNAPVSLRRREFDLLEYLMRHPGRCVQRDELMSEIWGLDFDTGTNVIDVQIYALRKKLTRAGAPPLITTVRGIGYRLGTDSGIPSSGIPSSGIPSPST